MYEENWKCEKGNFLPQAQRRGNLGPPKIERTLVLILSSLWDTKGFNPMFSVIPHTKQLTLNKNLGTLQCVFRADRSPMVRHSFGSGYSPIYSGRSQKMRNQVYSLYVFFLRHGKDLRTGYLTLSYYVTTNKIW